MIRHLLLFIVWLALPVRAEVTDAILRDWIAKQSSIRSLRADFLQTRRLPALRIPLKKAGTVWFGADGRFRWQVGNPVEMLVVKSPNEFLVIEPKKSLARRLSASSPASRVFQELPVPFAVSLEEFSRRFEVLSLENNAGRIDLLLRPKDPRLAEGMKSLRICFEASSGAVSHFEMAFRDGSEVSTEFTLIERNPKLAPELFQPDLSGFKIENPS
ncbi:MAG: LolA family protein [Spartobacteria bacterium]